MKGARAFFLIAIAFALLEPQVALAAVTLVTDPATLAALPPVSVVFTTSYDTNVSASSSAIAIERGLRQVDETYSPALAVNYYHQIGFQSFFLQGQGGYDFYDRNTILNRENIQVDGGTGLQFLDCSTTVTGSYDRRQSSLEDLSLEDLSLLQTKNTQEDASGALATTCNQSGLLVPSASVTRVLSSNTAALRQTSDYRNIAAQGSVLYRNGVIGQISLIGQYVEAVYPHRFVLIPGLADGYQMYGGGIRVQHNFGPRLAFAGTVSETSLRSDGGLGVNFNGLTYDTTLTYEFTSQLQAELDFSRKTNPATQLNATYAVEELDMAELEYRLTARTKLEFSASQTQQTFDGVALVQGIDLTRENVKTVSGTLAFDFTPEMSLDISANLDRRHADITAFSYSRARFSLTLSRAF